MRLLVIRNARAWGAGSRFPEAAVFRRGIEARGAEVDLVDTAAPGDAIDRARRAAGRYDRVVAAGGDGTVMEVATGLVESGVDDAVLAILPCGTGNDVARQLGLGGFEDALETLVRGRPTSIDTIEVTCRSTEGDVRRHGLMLAAAGFAGTLNRRVTPRLKRWVGRRFSYWVGLVSALIEYRSPRMRIRWNAGEIDEPTLTVIAANLERAGGGAMRVGPGADPTDGRLELSIVRRVPRRAILGQLIRLSRGTHVGHPAVRYGPCTEVSIESEPPAEVMVDGDTVGETPARFRVRPGAIRVMVREGGASVGARRILL